MIELYMKAGCNQTNIAKSLHINRDTLHDRVKQRYGKEYSEVSAAFACEGEMLIEAQQMQKAMKGYWPALLWLGKIRCGQKEPENMQMIPPHEDSLALRHEN